MSNEMVDAIELFPLRVKDVNIKATPIGSRGETSKYDPLKHEATIPIGANAYERTMRLHESLHAIYSSASVPSTVVAQTCEDLRLHLNHACLAATGEDGKPLPMRRQPQPRRDEVTAAIQDLRSIAAIESPYTMKRHGNELLGVFLRAVAILKGHAGWTPSSKATRYSHLIKSAYKKLDCKEKAKLGKSLKAAFSHLKSKDDIKIPIKILSKHFNAPKQNQGKNKGIANPLISLASASDLGIGHMKGFGDHEFAQIKLPKGVQFNQDSADQLVKLAKEEGLIPVVRMHRFALTHPKKSDKGPILISAYSGSKIRAKRLAAAMTSPVPIRLFKRKRINTEGGLGGTILIDASGSMNISDAQLEELMTLCPMGSIAYYDGVSDDDGIEAARAGGDIVVIAERGKQCDIQACKKHFPKRNEMNQIDLQAIQWMLTQPKPWYFLTDGGFTGSCTQIARDLLYSLLEQKHVKQVTSITGMTKVLKQLEAERLERSKHR